MRLMNIFGTDNDVPSDLRGGAFTHVETPNHFLVNSAAVIAT